MVAKIKKHICHVTTVHPVNDNRIFYKECISLQKKYDVTLVCAGAETGVVDGINVISFRKHRSRSKRFLITSFFDVFKQLRKVKADIYHFHDPELMPVGLLMRLLGHKVIYDVHENVAASILSKPYLRNAFNRKVVSYLVNIFERCFLNFYTDIVVARPDIAKKFGLPESRIINNFPRLSEINNVLNIQRSFEKEKYIIAFVGGMSRIRGILELVNAFKFIDNAELWLIGTIKESDLLEDCKKSDGWSRTRYIGQVPVAEIFHYLVQADIGVVTFLPEPNHVTTLATKPFEYMAAGLPMVMSEFEYWKETFRGSSLYVDPYDSKEIANAIERLMGDVNLRVEMSKINRRKVIDYYSWENEAKKLYSVYEENL